MALTVLSKTFPLGAGNTVYAGRMRSVISGRPAWRTSMASGSARTIPGTALSTVNPELNIATNSRYPSSAPYHGITGFNVVTNDYGGGAWDEATGTLWLPLQGGHADYAGNEPYKMCINVDAPAWTMLRKPSGWDNSIDFTGSGVAASGFYSDGRLRPGHAYNNNIYVPGIGPVICTVTGSFPGGYDEPKAYKLNETTGESTLLVDLSSFGVISYGGAVYDSANKKIYKQGTGNTPLVSINVSNPAAPTASLAVASNNFVSGTSHKMVVLPSLGLLAVFHGGGQGYPAQFYLRELSALNTLIQPSVTGTYSTGLTWNGQIGVDWDDVNQRFYIWNNASNTLEISTLRPSGDPRTQPWTAGFQAFTGTAPSAVANNGTYGRFGYSKKLGGCYLVNNTADPVHFFATE